MSNKNPVDKLHTGIRELFFRPWFKVKGSSILLQHNVNRFLLSILFFSLFTAIAAAQHPSDTATRAVTDTLPGQDTTLKDSKKYPATRIDSVSKRPGTDTGWALSPGIAIGSPRFRQEVLRHHRFFSFDSIPASLPPSTVRVIIGKDLLFYGIVFLLLLFAIFRRAFPKYFTDLFRLFFRTTLKQRQIKEQLVQTPLPSLLLNCFFVISGGLYITFLLGHYKVEPVHNFWLLFLYCMAGLSAAYLIKFIGLKVSGWLFNMAEAADSYIFIVFIINKMIGILLLPFLVLLAFALGDVYKVALTLSFCLVAGLLAYRVILTYGAIHNQVKVNPFHFFLYFLAFEIAPLLLVYKGLLLFFGLTA